MACIGHWHGSIMFQKGKVLELLEISKHKCISSFIVYLLWLKNAELSIWMSVEFNS